MKINQTHSPKYYVANDEETDDVLLYTAHKSLQGAWDKMAFFHGNDWEDQFPSICISLISIELAK